jgi:hypothetical protein
VLVDGRRDLRAPRRPQHLAAQAVDVGLEPAPTAPVSSPDSVATGATGLSERIATVSPGFRMNEGIVTRRPSTST